MNTDRKTPVNNKFPRNGTREVTRRNTPINLNSTISLSAGQSSSGKKFLIPPNRSNSRSNQTFRSQLDVTTVGLPSSSSTINPAFKSSLAAIYNVDHDLDCQLAYNEYLQALVKKQISQDEIKKHQEVLDDQIVCHSEQLDKLKDSYSDIIKNIEVLKVQSDIVEVINFLEENIEEIGQFCSDFNMFNKLNTLHSVLAGACNFVTVKNVRKIKSQHEYDTLIDTISRCVSVMEKILNSGRNIEKVNELAEIVRSTVNLKSDIEATQKLNTDLEKNSVYALLQSISDIFSKQIIGALN